MKRAKTQQMSTDNLQMSTDNLREFWLAQIEVFDEMTNLLEARRQRSKLSKPQRAWLVMMQSWRGELVRLLTEFPGTQHA
jgi:hypothetical protein